MPQIVARPVIGRVWWAAQCPYKWRVRPGTASTYVTYHEDDLGRYLIKYVRGRGPTAKSAIRSAKRWARVEQHLQDRPFRRVLRQRERTVRIDHQL